MTQSDTCLSLPNPTFYAAFSFHQWYPYLKKHTFISRIIELPDAFIEYLKQDGIQMSSSTKWYDYDDTVDTTAFNDDACSSFTSQAYKAKDFKGEEEEEEEGSLVVQEPPSFPELQRQIETTLQELGGFVLPKLNFSSPRDAAFMNLNGTLKSDSFDAIVLMLKSSDFIQFDLLCQPNPPILVLKKWIDPWYPSHEVRGWVRHGQFIALSQRDTSHYYPFLKDLQPQFIQLATEFVSNVLSNVPCLPSSYSFDLYFSPTSLTPFVMDLHPFDSHTDPCLFTWSELHGHDTTTNNTSLEPSSLVSFQSRFVESEESIQTHTYHQESYNRFPYDFVLYSQGQTLTELETSWKAYVQEGMIEDTNGNESESE